MGGKHRLSRDARLREAGHRRTPRVPAALRADIGRVECRSGAAIAGIDVGEKFLDVAIADPAGRSLKFTEIDLRDMRVSVVDAIAAAMRDRAPELLDCEIAIIDSPLYPLGTRGQAKEPRSAGRSIDAALRCVVHLINGRRGAQSSVAFSLYPTPAVSYFGDGAIYTERKPYLLSIAREHLKLNPAGGAATASSGRLFTRFMLVGFATYAALEKLGVPAFEGFPHLSFAMWRKPDERLASKRKPSAALASRRKIIERLASEGGVVIDWGESRSLRRRVDQADAAVLALGAATGAGRGGLFAIRARDEGSFLLAVNGRDRLAVEDLLAPRGANSA